MIVLGSLSSQFSSNLWGGAARRLIPLLFLVSACTGDEPDYEWNLPKGFPEPEVPADNPMSEAKVELGRHLFYDTRLSVNETSSCASCHDQSRAFSDGLALPTGATGQTVPRNSPQLANVGYYSTLTWPNPLLTTIERQVLIPLFSETPIELGAAGKEDEILARLRSDNRYVELFAAAFPDVDDPFSFVSIQYAVSSFCRSMISGSSPYDRFVYGGDANAISDSAKRGEALFFSERLECHHCHNTFMLSSSAHWKGKGTREQAFHNIGLYNVGGNGDYPVDNPGLYELTAEENDKGKFRVPSLRNVAITAPYMHDGSIATLDEVIDLYARGGRNVESGPNAGDGRENPYKSGFMTGFPLSAQERADLKAFLESLTDEAFLSDPRFSNPFAE